MNILFDCKLIAEKYIHKMSILDVGLLKFCLGSLGILVGTGIANGSRKRAVRAVSCVVFVLTYLYLTTSFVLHCAEEVKAMVSDYEKDF